MPDTHLAELQNYVDRFGPEAGPRLYHAMRSRASYKAASTRARRRIAELMGLPFRERRPERASRAVDDAPWLPGFEMAGAEGETA